MSIKISGAKERVRIPLARGQTWCQLDSDVLRSPEPDYEKSLCGRGRILTEPDTILRLGCGQSRIPGEPALWGGGRCAKGQGAWSPSPACRRPSSDEFLRMGKRRFASRHCQVLEYGVGLYHHPYGKEHPANRYVTTTLPSSQSCRKMVRGARSPKREQQGKGRGGTAVSPNWIILKPGCLNRRSTDASARGTRTDWRECGATMEQH